MRKWRTIRSDQNGGEPAETERQHPQRYEISASRSRTVHANSPNNPTMDYRSFPAMFAVIHGIDVLCPKTRKREKVIKDSCIIMCVN